MSDGARVRVDRGTFLVAAQVVCLAVVWLWPGPPAWSVPAWVAVAGWALIAVAVVVGVSGAGTLGRYLRVHPRPAGRAELRTGGVYRYVRHPIYLAVLLGSVGEVLRSGRLEPAAGLLALALVLHLKADYEESLLRETFGEAYDVYASRVPRIVPRVRSVLPSRG